MTSEDLRAKAETAAAGLESMAAVLDAASANLSGSWTAASEWADRLRERATARRNRRFTIMIMGEFKRGKSTLLNALLGDRVLPQKPTPCTAVITRIKYGPVPEVRVLFGDGRAEEVMTPPQFEERYSLEVQDTVHAGAGRDFDDEDEEEAHYDKVMRDRFGHISEAVIDFPAPLCEDGVELVDSPGLSEHSSREARTLNDLRDADAVVMVLSAVQFLARRERRIVTKNLPPFRDERKLFFAINRWNQILDSVVDPDDEAEIRSVFSDQEKQIDLLLRPLLGPVADQRLFRLNALGALQCRKKGVNGEVLEKTGVPALENGLKRFLAEDRLRAEQSSDRELAGSIRMEVMRHLQMEQRALAMPISALEAEYAASQPRLEALRARKRHIENLVKASAADLEQLLCDSLERFFAEEINAKLERDSKDFEVGPAGKMLTRLGGMFDRWRSKENKVSTQIETHIANTINEYLTPKITDWNLLYAKPLIQRKMQELGEALSDEMRDYGRELDKITNGSGGEQAIQAIIRNGFKKLNPRLGEEFKGLGMDLTPLVAGVVADVVTHMVFHTVLNAALPGIGLLVSGCLLWWRSGKIKDQTQQSMADSLRDGLPKLRLSFQDGMRKEISDAFQKVTANINQGVDAQINHVDATMRDIIAQKEQHEFDARARQTELDSFQNEFVRATDDLVAKLAV